GWNAAVLAQRYGIDGSGVVTARWTSAVARTGDGRMRRAEPHAVGSGAPDAAPGRPGRVTGGPARRPGRDGRGGRESAGGFRLRRGNAAVAPWDDSTGRPGPIANRPDGFRGVRGRDGRDPALTGGFSEPTTITFGRCPRCGRVGSMSGPD